MFFGTDFLCKCNPQPILKKIISSNGRIEYVSVVQNRTVSASDSEILLESFSDEEDKYESKRHDSNEISDEKKISSADLNEESSGSNITGNNNNDDADRNAKVKESPDLKSHHDAAEIRRLLRRKDELERKQKMQERYNERLQVSADKHFLWLFIFV